MFWKRKKEKWVDIKQANNAYQLSDLGNVKNKATGILLTLQQQHRFTYVMLIVDGCTKSFKVADLVAEYFVANPCNYKYVVHIDGNCHNNASTNLRYSDTREPYNNRVPSIKKRTLSLNELLLPFANISLLFTDNWVNIQGYKGRYKVSESGKVLDVSNPLKPILVDIVKIPYSSILGVCLELDGKYYHEPVATLVAKAFLRELSEYEYISHKDGNCYNNASSNLAIKNGLDEGLFAPENLNNNDNNSIYNQVEYERI